MSGTLTAEGCRGRRERLWRALSSPCDLLILGDPSSLIYFSNYVPTPFEFRTAESSAALVLTPDRSFLIADNLLQPYLEKSHVDSTMAAIWYDGSRPTEPRRIQLVESILASLSGMRLGRIGVELSGVPAGVVEGLRSRHLGLEIVDIGPLIRPMRRSKDADELAVLGRAMKAGEAGQAAALAEIRPGMTELDAYLIVQSAAMKALGERAIVYGDFASGPRTATDKGGPPTSRVIEAGDLLLLDFSVIVGGYRSDFTNTFVVGRKATSKQRELFASCVGALEAAEAVLRPGTVAGDIDAAVRRRFAADGLLDHFPHHTGHGIGLGHPEPPYFIPDSPEILVVGDVVTVEPGLYVEGVGGIRIERNYAITEGGYELLSKHEIRVDQ